MAGHSKWHNIKHKKAKEDAKRGKLFTRMIREIMIVARDGGGDLDGNARLRLLVEKAKAANMPKENIDRAIKKGTGELESESLESILYEAYGPNGIAVMVHVLTDNRNRTVADLRHFFSKNGGHMADGGSVAWMFENKGVIDIEREGLSEDDLLEKLINYEIDDVHVVDENSASIICASKDLDHVRHEAEECGISIDSAELRWIPKEVITVSEDASEKVYGFLDKLEDQDDVQHVYANV